MVSKQGSSETTEILRDLLIVQLLLAGVPQDATREIARCGMKRVSAIGKALKNRKEGSA